MNTDFDKLDLSKIPHTGVKKALFFNGFFARNLECALEYYLPDEIVVYLGKARMRQALVEEGLAESTNVPETVPYYQPESEYGDYPKHPTKRVAMIITDRDPEQFQSAVSFIGQYCDKEFWAYQKEYREHKDDPEYWKRRHDRFQSTDESLRLADQFRQQLDPRSDAYSLYDELRKPDDDEDGMYIDEDMDGDMDEGMYGDIDKNADGEMDEDGDVENG